MTVRLSSFTALAGAVLALGSVLTVSPAPVAASPVGPCAAGTYSPNGQQPCDPIPSEFDTAGCWTLTVPAGSDSVDVDAIGAAGNNGAGLGDGMSVHALGLSAGNQLRVCVDQGGGAGGAGVVNGGDGGGASGVSTGSDFSHPFLVAGAGGGGAGGYYGGDAGMPDAQPGVNGGGGGSNTSSSGGAGGQSLYPGVNRGSDGAGFDANGPGRGGSGGAGADNAPRGGGGGGGGYFAGGGGGNGDSGGTGAGGGTSYCGTDHVSLTLTDCARTAHAGTDHAAGSAAGQAKVALTFHARVKCAAGTYSPDGMDSPVGCQPIPAAFTTAGCWTLTVPADKNIVNADVIGAAGAQGYKGTGGSGDEMTGVAVGLANGDQLRLCVDQGGGDGAGNSYFDGGGASGVSFGTDFSQPFIVAGGGGASAVGQGGNAGMPLGQTGGGNGPGTGGDNTAHHGGTGGISNAYNNGGDGHAFSVAGPGTGGFGGQGRVGFGAYMGGAGGAGYYGGGGAGGGDDLDIGTYPGGGGGGTSFCGADNVSLTVTDCVRNAGAGTGHEAGSGAGQPKVTLTFSSGTQCDVGYYSATGNEPCTPAAPGHFVDTLGATAQTDCDYGYYQPNTAASSCLPADIGYYVDTTAASSETKCPDGTTTAGTGSTSSADCVATSLSYQPDAMIRLSGSPRVGAGVYSTDGTGETITLKPRPYRIGAVRTFFAYVQNDGSVADSFTMHATGVDVAGYVVTYKRGSGMDVTTAVESGAFTTPVLQPGHTYGIRVTVTFVAGAGHGTHVQRLIQTTSVGDSGQQDAVVFALTRK